MESNLNSSQEAASINSVLVPRLMVASKDTTLFNILV